MTYTERDELLAAIDVETFLDREGYQYRPTRGSSGPQFNIKTCPFCGGSEWKVYVNQDNGLGNCFSGSCQTTFGKRSFIKATLNGSSDAEVRRYIKTLALEQGWRQKKTIKYAVDNLGELYLPESVELPFNGKNLKYLIDRGISSEIASYFFLRYSKAGKYKYNDGVRDRSQDYSNRIIIPIYDLGGTLVSFQGRTILPDVDKRYLFPPGFSSTGKYLYNGMNALGSKRIVINEGVFDVFSTKMALDEDVSLRDVTPVGSFGKHLSNGFGDDQISQLIKLKSRGLKEVVFLWDGEKEATRSAVRSALIVSRLGIKTRVAILPDGKDPNISTTCEIINAFNQAVTITKLSAIKLLSQLSQ